MTEIVVSLLIAAAPADEGERLFRQRCAECHTVRELERPLKRRPPAERAGYLERFLQKHYAPDAAERKAIVEFLSP